MKFLKLSSDWVFYVELNICYLALPVFDYGDLVWCDKNNVTLINDIQALQNKAAKIILDRPLYSSATDAPVTLKWLNLEQRRFYQRCIYIYKCINGLTDHSMNLLTHIGIHNYNIIQETKTCSDLTPCYQKLRKAGSLPSLYNRLE